MFQSYLERSALWERQEKIIISRRYILSEKEKKKVFWMQYTCSERNREKFVNLAKLWVFNTT